MAQQYYHCNACQAQFLRSQVVAGAWGDSCCPECSSPDIARQRSQFERWYATFFLYKVY